MTKILSFAAFIASLAALTIVLGRETPPVSMDQSEIRRYIDHEVKSQLAHLREEIDDLPHRPAATTDADFSTHPLPPREQVNAWIEETLRSKMASSDFVESALGGVLHLEANTDEWKEPKAIDLSGYLTLEDKVAAILKAYDGVNSYGSDNPLTKQLMELGHDAVPLLAEFLRKGASHEQWAAQMAVDEAMNALLTEEDRDLALELFMRDGSMSKVLNKFRFPEANDLVFEKLKQMSFREPNMGSMQSYEADVLEMALDYDRERALPHILQAVENGACLQQVLGVVGSDPTIDLKPQLKSALNKCTDPWSRQSVGQAMLARGMPEGLEALVQNVDQSGSLSDHEAQESLKMIRKYTGYTGSDGDVLKKLRSRMGQMTWNPETQKFE